MSAGGEINRPDPAAAPSAAAGTGTDTDGDLLRRLAGGERGEALRGLSERYAARLYDLGLTVFGEHQTASRLAAETIDAVASRAAEFGTDDGRSAPDFIYGVARDRAAQIAASDPERATDVADGEELRAVLAGVEFRAAVAGLGEEERGVVEAILGEGLTRAETGERLGLTVGIVEVRLRTGLRAVRDELNARGVAADGRR